MPDAQLDKIECKIDKIQEKMGAIDATLASQHEVLKDHTRRSLASEQAISILAEKLQPVITHVAIMKLCGKMILTIAGSEIAWSLIKKVLNV